MKIIFKSNHKMLENCEKFVNIEFLSLFEEVKNKIVSTEDYAFLFYTKFSNLSRDQDKLKNTTLEINYQSTYSPEYVLVINDPWKHEFIVDQTYDENDDEKEFMFRIDLKHALVYRVKKQFKYMFPTFKHFESFINFISPQFKFIGERKEDPGQPIHYKSFEEKYKLYSIPIIETNEGLKINFDHLNNEERACLKISMINQ